MMIRLLLVDDHTLLRKGLRHLLEDCDGITVVGETAEGAEAIRLVEELAPDVALVDLSMPRMDGIELTGELLKLGLPTRVLILTMFSDGQHAVRTLRAGAHGFISKTASVEELVAAIRQVNAGERYLPPDIESDLNGDAATDSPAGGARTPAELLSRREFQVMCSLAGGKTNREIAEELGISVKTVDTHRGHVLKKLQLRNNSDITRFAIRNGYLDS
jgi:DNA-binding NarL/FixJ family response regulator